MYLRDDYLQPTNLFFHAIIPILLQGKVMNSLKDKPYSVNSKSKKCPQQSNLFCCGRILEQL